MNWGIPQCQLIRATTVLGQHPIYYCPYQKIDSKSKVNKAVGLLAPQYKLVVTWERPHLLVANWGNSTSRFPLLKHFHCSPRHYSIRGYAVRTFDCLPTMYARAVHLVRRTAIWTFLWKHSLFFFLFVFCFFCPSLALLSPPYSLSLLF